MAFFDKLKDVTEKAMESAASTAQRAKEGYDQMLEEQARKKAEKAAYEQGMNQRAEQTSNAYMGALAGAFKAEESTLFMNIGKEELLAFTKNFYDKLFMPGSSISRSSLVMYPYIDEKKKKAIHNSLAVFADQETVIFYFKGNANQEFMLTDHNFYFKMALAEDNRYAARGILSVNQINKMAVRQEEGKYVFFCNGCRLAEWTVDMVPHQDIIVMNEYFSRIENKQFEITDVEVDQIIQQKIGPKVYGELKKYMVFDGELAIYFAWGADSIEAKDYILCTTKQIIFLDREFFGATANIRQFYYEDITSCAVLQNSESSDLTSYLIDTALTSWLKLCDLVVNVAGAQTKISILNKMEAERVVAIYHEYRAKAKEQNTPNVVINQQAQPDILDQIQKLAELKTLGILTEEEFATKKAELLAKL